MSFTGSYITNSFQTEVFGGIHVFGTDTFKIALYTSSATLNASTTAYSSTNEVSGTGYVAGGTSLSGYSLTSWATANGTVITISWNNPAWASSSITARGALIYNSSKANRSVMVIDFGSDKTTSNQTFTVVLPSNTANTAIIRSAIVPNPLS